MTVSIQIEKIDQEFLSWLKAQDPKDTYLYYDPTAYAFTQFLRETVDPAASCGSHTIYLNGWNQQWKLPKHIDMAVRGQTDAHRDEYELLWTFGQAALRLEEAMKEMAQ